MTVVITGASGMIGAEILAELKSAGRPVRILSHARSQNHPAIETEMLPLPRSDDSAFRAALQGATHVVHCAAVNNDNRSASGDLFEVNAILTGKLAKAAAQSVPGRFIYLSSIRAVAGAGQNGVINEDTIPAPTCAYGRSKLAGEQAVREAYARDTHGRAAILRLAPVYGRAMRGGLQALLNMADTAWPLPIGSLTSAKPVLSLSAAVQAVIAVLEHDHLGQADYVVSDAPSISLADIVASFRDGLSRPRRIFPVPLAIFSAAATAFGKQSAWERITAGQICDSSALGITGWHGEADSRKALAALARDIAV